MSASAPGLGACRALGPVDLRLLVPALAAWGCGAATLALAGTVRVVLAGALLSAGGVLAALARRRARAPARHARHRAGPGLAGAAMVVGGVRSGAGRLRTAVLDA